MPKEGFHLFLADRLIEFLGENIPAPVRREGLAFSIGSLSPDIFFYDFPSFSQSSLGGSLHDLMEREGIAPIEEWIVQTCRQNSFAFSDKKLAWALGFASHFLADGIWHPVINDLSRSLGFCAEEGLSEVNCHRMLEGELEAFWLGREGVTGFYVGLLNRFRENRNWLFEIASFYRQFLQFTGLERVPPENKIPQCYLKQNFLLRLFANPVLTRRRDRLMTFRPTRYIGALVVPERPVLPAMLSRSLSEARNPFSGYFMENGLTSLKAQFSGLSERLPPFLPS
ncbi:MAG: zinc dependent phospholipase C family protein [Syntrophobacteraceae bacterium]